MASKDNRKAHVKASSKAQAGLDRADYFARPGATATGWFGGPHTVTKNRRKEASRKACRGRVR